MKIKKMMKHLFMLLLITAMVLPWMAEVNAATESTNYDALDDKGTITIYKYEGGDTTRDSSGIAQTAPTTTDTTKPLAGVTFAIKKIADVEIVDGVLKYKLTDQTAADKFGLTVNQIYTSTELESKVQALTQANAEAIVGTDNTVKTAETAETTGLAEFTNLEYGLYLVVETNAPSNVIAKSVPFLASIPSIKNGAQYAGNTTWTTNVTAYPKNNLGNATFEKKIVDNNTSVESVDAKVGDTINYQLDMTVPIPDGGLKQLYVIDEMSKGLTYDTLTSIEATDSNGDAITLDNDYTITSSTSTDDATVIKIIFQDSGLTKLSSNGASSATITIKYTAKLNANAVLGDAGNTNSANMYYSNSGSAGTDPDGSNATKANDTDEKTTVYTYGIRVTKKDGSNNAALDGVEFKLYSTYNTTTNEVSDEVLINGVAGTYTTSSGVVEIRGIPAGTYYLKETKTKNGYVLLTEPIKVVIPENPSATSKATVNTDTNVTMISDTDNASSKYALVPITVINDKGFSLPTTGAEGTAMFAFLGIFLVIVAGTLLIIKKRQR